MFFLAHEKIMRAKFETYFATFHNAYAAFRLRRIDKHIAKENTLVDYDGQLTNADGGSLSANSWLGMHVSVPILYDEECTNESWLVSHSRYKYLPY